MNYYLLWISRDLSGIPLAKSCENKIQIEHLVGSLLHTHSNQGGNLMERNTLFYNGLSYWFVCTDSQILKNGLYYPRAQAIVFQSYYHPCDFAPLVTGNWIRGWITDPSLASPSHIFRNWNETQRSITCKFRHYQQSNFLPCGLEIRGTGSTERRGTMTKCTEK